MYILCSSRVIQYSTSSNTLYDFKQNLRIEEVVKMNSSICFLVEFSAVKILYVLKLALEVPYR